MLSLAEQEAKACFRIKVLGCTALNVKSISVYGMLIMEQEATVWIVWMVISQHGLVDKFVCLFNF